ncbi:rCG54058 [Rattus norvegicus]|uniref:RCG54058 n=1 Tax=Rattus norvegicus TaxID=10116 RepID=A6JA94_RAT|nr:rCG54058 [Rattus norvegicus]
MLSFIRVTVVMVSVHSSKTLTKTERVHSSGWPSPGLVHAPLGKSLLFTEL